MFECVCMWARKLDLSAKAFEQIVHLKGFSPTNKFLLDRRCREKTVKFTSMSTDVSLQQPWSRETLAAVLAFAALIMGAHVHGVRRHADVKLVAVRTATSLFVCWAAVCLAVTGEVTRGAVSKQKG